MDWQGFEDEELGIWWLDVDGRMFDGQRLDPENQVVNLVVFNGMPIFFRTFGICASASFLPETCQFSGSYLQQRGDEKHKKITWQKPASFLPVKCQFSGRFQTVGCKFSALCQFVASFSSHKSEQMP